MLQREIEVPGSISSIILLLGKYFDISKDVWFRGQPTYDCELTPSIFRQGKAFGRQFDESKMYKEFVRRYPEQSGTHKDVYEWLTLMRHYGIPTRLLDWTTNLLVALYFSCSQDSEEDGALFVLDPAPLTYFGFSPLMEMQVISTSISDFYSTLTYKMGDILDDEARINGMSIAEIKKDAILQQRFVHITEAKKSPLKSVEMKVLLGKATYTIADDANLVPKESVANLLAGFIYSDITPVFSNIVPFRAPHLNLRAKQQHGCFTYHGGKYFEGEEFLKCMKMEEHPQLKNNLVKLRIRASDIRAANS